MPGGFMSELIVISDSCQSCGSELPNSGNYCSHCGTPAVLPTALAHQTGVITHPQQIPAYAPQIVVVPQTGVSPIEKALDNRLCVVAIILVAGPIGLPALWFSRRFSKRAKIISTVAYFLLTAVLPLVAIWYFLEVSLRPLLNVFSG
jgi:hypothetical protein